MASTLTARPEAEPRSVSGRTIEAASARAVASPAGTTLDDDARELLQRRTKTLSLILALIGGGFLLIRILDVLIGQHGSWAENYRSLLPHGAAVAVFTSVWLATRGRNRSATFLRRIDSVGFIVGCTAYTFMAPNITVLVRPEMILLMALTMTVFARAAYIPSTGRRTAVFGAVVALPVIASTAFTYYSQLDVVMPLVADHGISQFALVFGRTTNAATWWAASVTVAALTSHMIYGLRRDIREVRRLGRYELVQQIGEGGMGEVYEARHALLERPTAVKLLPLDASGARSLQFEREVQLTAQLSHPNTVTIFDYGRTADGVFYYAMELIDGLTLEQLVDMAGPLSPGRAVHVLRQAAGALVEAHGVGLIHRDIKPANVMLSLPHAHGGVHEVTKVLDFGLAKDIRAMDVDGSQVNTLRGTPLYMSPEAIRTPAHVDSRSDIYALGAVAYFLLTGEPVFRGATVIEVCSQHLYEVASTERLAATGAPDVLQRLVLRCLEKAPEDRPASALAILQQLERIVDARWTPEEAHHWWAAHTEETARAQRASRRATSGVRAITLTHGRATK